MKYSLKRSLLAIAFVATLALTIAPATAFASPMKPASQYCDPGWIYDNVSNAGADYIGLGSTFYQYNPYSYTMTVNWSVTVNGSVTVTASAGVSGDLSIIVAEVKGTVNASVAYTVGVSATEGVLVPVPSHKAVNGQFSIERQKTYGHLYYLMSNCAIGSNYGTVEAWTPWRPTWHLW